MGTAPDIVDISSDEEDFGPGKPDDVASYDWISELLDHVDGGDIDDVMVVGELSAPTAARRRGAPRDESDDDCLVLDGDPDKPVTIVDDKSGGGGGSDDLLIVGEKGQLACRDYPHPRHLCVNFPFSTTPHEKHCNLCHCYVCDSPAPCVYWSNGVPSADHCHSTDKEGQWKYMRKSFKQRNMAPPPPPLVKPPDTTLSMMPTLKNPISIHHPNPTFLPTLSSKSSTLRSCLATSVTTRSPLSQRHNQRPIVITYRGQRLTEHPTRSQPLISGTRCVQREKRGASAVAGQIMGSHAKFRRVGTAGNGLISNNTNWTQHVVSNHNQVYRAAPQRSQSPPVALVEENMKKWQDVLEGVAAELGVSDNSNRISTSVQPREVSSQPSVFSQYVSQTNASQNVDPFVHSAPPTTNSGSLGYDYDWLNNNPAAQNIAEYGRAEDPQPVVTLQPSNPSVSGERHLESFLASVEQGTLPEAGKEPGFSELDSGALLFDFDSTWSSSTAQV